MKYLFALTMTVGIATPAFAQSQNITTAARRTIAEITSCLTLREQGRVAQLIALQIDSADYRRGAQYLYDRADNACGTDGTYEFNAVLFNGALFDALYQRDFGYSGPTAFPANVTTRYAERYKAPYSLDARRAIALEGFGECVARADPAGARKLALSTLGSAAENQQFAALAPHFRACVVNGAKVEMSKAVVRGAVAEGLYRLSVATAHSTTGTNPGA